MIMRMKAMITKMTIFLVMIMLMIFIMTGLADMLWYDFNSQTTKKRAVAALQISKCLGQLRI